MISRLATLPVFLLLVAFTSVQAQKTLPPPAKIDWTDSSDVLDMDTPTWMKLSSVKPQMELWGGPSTLRRDGTAPLEGSTSFGITLGSVRSRQRDEKTAYSSNDGVYLWYAMAKDQPQPPVTLTTDVWRFGFVSTKGFGYELNENMAVNFYAGSSALSWSIVNPKSNVADSLQNLALREFEGSVRFGAAAQAGIGLQLTKNIELRGSYDWTQIYPRHLFWFWAGSGAIEGVADALAMAFVKAVGRSSPAAAPIMYFVLKNAVSMGFAGLRQHQMNWPFETVAPMNIQTWRISGVFTF